MVNKSALPHFLTRPMPITFLCCNFQLEQSRLYFSHQAPILAYENSLPERAAAGAFSLLISPTWGMCTSRGRIRIWIVFENMEIDKAIAWCFAENGLLWGVCVISWHFKIVSSASTQASRSHRVSVMRPWRWPCWPWSPELGRVTENLCWGCERRNGPLERMQGEELRCEVWVNNAFSQLTFRRSEMGHSHRSLQIIRQ